MSISTNDELEDLRRVLACRHHRIGWWGLLVFLTLGGFLESLHGFKAGFYLDLDHKTRREMWRLAHAHGTLLALVHIGFAAGLGQFGHWTRARLRVASFFLTDAALLIPAGFFLGGLLPTEVDPWLGVLLVPAGALLLFVAVALTACSAGPPRGGPGK